MDFIYHVCIAAKIDKIKELPRSFWLNIGIGVAAFFLVVFLFRKAQQLNRFAVLAIVLIFVGIVLVNWVYNRSEPKFLSPIVDYIAPFLPTAGYVQKEYAK